MNKTALYSVCVITFGIVLVSSLVIDAHKKIALKTQTQEQIHIETKDRFTVCLQTVMSEARQGGKPIQAVEAKDICLQAERF